ncbi:hypothetical protein [Robbsia andropogonis]|nr:hypothetical protein [Robbsia andropogonis]
MNPASSAAVPHAMPGRITRPVLVVAGMVLEADAVRGATGLDVRVAMGPAARDPDGRLAHLLPTVSGIVSFGTAGALDPTLRPGDCLLPSAVVDASGRQWATDAHWRAALATQWQRQGQSPVTCHQGLIAGSDTAVCSTADKAAWFSQTRASAVDMESHALAALAASYGLPFLVCRVVLDRADHDVPAAAMAGLTADGRTTVLPVIGALLREPGQLGALLRLGRDASTAQKTLKAIAAHLPPHFGLPDTALRR